MSLRSVHNMPSNPNGIRGVSFNQRQRTQQRPVAPTIAIQFGMHSSADISTLFKQPLQMPDIPLPEREIHLANLSQVLWHAQASRDVYSNLSKRHYGAMVILDNGIKSIATNIEASRQFSICDLRAAITQGINQSIDTMKDCPTKLPTPTVKTIYLVNATVESDSPVPCSDCQEWLNSRFCTPDTQVISLENGPNNQGWAVHSRTVRDMLPLHIGRGSLRLTTEKSLADLPLVTSKTAFAILEQAEYPTSAAQLRKLLTQAQSAYQQNQSDTANSGLQTGVCMILSPFETMTSGGRFDWSTRWHEAADLSTAVQAFQQTERIQQAIRTVSELSCLPRFIKKQLQPWLEPPKIQAIAYYGNDPNLPPLASLGRIARERGSSNTLIVTVENDRIQLRTIADFMPEMYRTKPNLKVLCG